MDEFCAQHTDALEQQAALLAHHCEQAGFTDQAVSHYSRAGWQAVHRGASTEAYEQFGKVLRLSSELPPGAGQIEAELGALIGLTTSVVNIGPAGPEFGRLAARATELAAQLPTRLEFLRAFYDLTIHHMHRCNFDSSLKIGKQLAEWGEEQNDSRGQVC